MCSYVKNVWFTLIPLSVAAVTSRHCYFCFLFKYKDLVAVDSPKFLCL
jgi:hypothetical protein